MAIAVSTTAVGGTPTAQTVTSGTLTTDGSATGCLIAIIPLYSGGGSDFIDTVTWNVGTPQNFTRVIGSADGTNWSTPDGRNGDTDRHCEVWRLLNPTAATDDVTATAGNFAEPTMEIAVYYLTGVDQTTPITTANILQAFGSSGTAAVGPVTSAVGGLVIDGVECGVVGSPMSSDGTEIMDRTDTTQAGASSYKDGAASVSFSHTLLVSTDWLNLAVPLNAAAGGGGATIYTPEKPIGQGIATGVGF